MSVFWDLDTCRHSPSLNLFILGLRLTAPDRHEEKLAHHAGGIAEQREKVRKLLAFDGLRLSSFFQRLGKLAQIFFLFLTLV